MSAAVIARPAVLPPKALLIALVSQVPLAIGSLLLRPSIFALAFGGLLTSAGLVLNLWAEPLFRKHGVGVCPFSPVPHLIVQGPYRWIRNPMYIGLIMIDLGVALATGVMGNAWSAIALALFLHYGFVIPEERSLEQQIGQPFRDYMAHTGRWFPRRVGRLKGP